MTEFYDFPASPGRANGFTDCEAVVRGPHGPFSHEVDSFIVLACDKNAPTTGPPDSGRTPAATSAPDIHQLRRSSKNSEAGFTLVTSK